MLRPMERATFTPSSARLMRRRKTEPWCWCTRTYREVLTIDKPNIRLRSANAICYQTVVVNDRSAGANGGTLHSATANVTAD